MNDIMNKLGSPCIFIRYNPDHKNSDKNLLLEKVKQKLDKEEDVNYKPWSEKYNSTEFDLPYGLYVEYLFYD